MTPHMRILGIVAQITSIGELLVYTRLQASALQAIVICAEGEVVNSMLTSGH